MRILLGIVFFHLLVILRAKQAVNERPPYMTTLFLTAMMVIYVVIMLYSMEAPE